MRRHINNVVNIELRQVNKNKKGRNFPKSEKKLLQPMLSMCPTLMWRIFVSWFSAKFPFSFSIVKRFCIAHRDSSVKILKTTLMRWHDIDRLNAWSCERSSKEEEKNLLLTTVCLIWTVMEFWCDYIEMTMPNDRFYLASIRSTIHSLSLSLLSVDVFLKSHWEDLRQTTASTARRGGIRRMIKCVYRTVVASTSR